jgi:hypothetical protein
MLRKLEQNIFPYPGRQVHAIVNDRDRFLTLKGQMIRPRIQLEPIIEVLQAPYTLAPQSQAQTALHKQASLELLDL